MSDEEKHRQSCSYCLTTQGGLRDTYLGRAEKAERERDGAQAALKACCDDMVVATDYARRAESTITEQQGAMETLRGLEQATLEDYRDAEAKLARVEALVEPWRQYALSPRALICADELEAALTVEEEAKG